MFQPTPQAQERAHLQARASVDGLGSSSHDDNSSSDDVDALDGVEGDGGTSQPSAASHPVGIADPVTGRVLMPGTSMNAALLGLYTPASPFSPRGGEQQPQEAGVLPAAGGEAAGGGAAGGAGGAMGGVGGADAGQVVAVKQDNPVPPVEVSGHARTAQEADVARYAQCL